MTCRCCAKPFDAATNAGNLCPACEDGEELARECVECRRIFEAEYPDDRLCSWCHSEASHHDREEHDFTTERAFNT